LINPISNDHISSISDLELRDLEPIITAVMSEDKIYLQVPVLELCLKQILFEMDCSSLRSPQPEQVYTLCHLIFGKANILLIVQIGFGKSLIFHVYLVLTGKITLQIILLSKLGEEQLSDIQKLGYTNPCLIISENKKKEKDLIERFQKYEFTYVLLGPEQVSSKTF
jgi:superfamily II DNA helicase RecQ